MEMQPIELTTNDVSAIIKALEATGAHTKNVKKLLETYQEMPLVIAAQRLRRRLIDISSNKVKTHYSPEVTRAFENSSKIEALQRENNDLMHDNYNKKITISMCLSEINDMLERMDSTEPDEYNEATRGLIKFLWTIHDRLLKSEKIKDRY